jgi:dolichyldiphosphatase
MVANHSTAKMTLLVRIAQAWAVITAASMVCISRIYLRYHTPRQVLFGVAIGAFLGVAWYIMVMILRMTGWVDWVLHLKAVELFWFKDGDIGSLEHDLREEWVEWRSVEHAGEKHVVKQKRR